MQDIKFGDEIEIVLDDFKIIKVKVGLNNSLYSLFTGEYIGDLWFDGKIRKDNRITGWIKQ